MTKLTASQRQKLIPARTIQWEAASDSTPKKRAAKRPHTPYSKPSSTTAQNIASNDFIIFLSVEFLLFNLLFSFHQTGEQAFDDRVLGAIGTHT
jgi:hypothetical protein